MQIGDSINTLSWSLMPGIGLQDKIKDGMLVINKSRIFVRRVGEFTIWVRLWFARKSINIIITKFNWRVVASFQLYNVLTAKLLLSLVTFVPLCPRVLDSTHLRFLALQSIMLFFLETYLVAIWNKIPISYKVNRDTFCRAVQCYFFGVM